MIKDIIVQDCIALVEVKTQLLAGKNIQIIDVRRAEEFAEKHIREAINIPLDALEGVLSQLDKSYFFITTCGKGGGRSATGAAVLQQAGFQSAWLCGGTFGWVE